IFNKFILTSLFILLISIFHFSCTSEIKKSILIKTDTINPIISYKRDIDYTNIIPDIYINTMGKYIVEDPKILANLKLMVNDTLFFDKTIGIELRGSSSLFFDQKSYGFECWNNMFEGITDTIMDFPPEEDFILYGPANDKSLLRNVLISEIANQMGMYASRTRFVNLYLNNSYNGLYILMEKIKRDKNRVNISKLASTSNSGVGLTGGYIFKIDKSTSSNTNQQNNYTVTNSFRSNYDTGGKRITLGAFGTKKNIETYFLFDYPDYDVITTQQKQYLQNYINEFEDSLLSANFADTVKGYPKFIDVNSFIETMLLNEFSINPDAYRLSTFFYKDKSNKLKSGPIWDYNLAFGNYDRPYIYNGSDWIFNFNNYYPNDLWLVHFWWKRFLKDPNFVKLLKQKWANLRLGVLSNANIESIINNKYNLLTSNNAINKHFQRWDFLGKKLPYNNFVGQTYSEELNYLLTKIRNRLEWMDINIQYL
ncbi:MAG: CotH kinase family protein, partial [Sediminibacterium sp.]|nr:CotH kinase family protein [Sediminibacterium sp.]